MDDQDDRPAVTTPRTGASRRAFLVGSGVLVAGAGAAGVALGVAATEHGGKHDTVRPLVPTVPQALDDAIEAEHELIAIVDAALPHSHPRTKRALRAIRADHTAHLAALEAAREQAAYPAQPSSTPAQSGVSTPAAATGSTVADVRRSERRASRAAAARGARLSGRTAALLASIAASEATHAQVLA